MVSIREKLKSYLKAKFKSLRRYCDLTDQSDRHGYLNKLLMNKSDLSKHNETTLCREFEKALMVTNSSLRNEITKAERVRIKNFVCVTYITNTNFCRFNKVVSIDSLSRIIGGVTVKKNRAFEDIMRIVELNEPRKWRR